MTDVLSRLKEVKEEEKTQDEDEFNNEDLYKGASQRIKKQKVLGLFERFRSEYDFHSRGLHMNLRNEGKLLEKVRLIALRYMSDYVKKTNSARI